MESREESNSPETFQWGPLDDTGDNTDEEEESIPCPSKRLIFPVSLRDVKNKVSSKQTFKSWDWKRKSSKASESEDEEERPQYRSQPHVKTRILSNVSAIKYDRKGTFDSKIEVPIKSKLKVEATKSESKSAIKSEQKENKLGSEVAKRQHKQWDDDSKKNLDQSSEETETRKYEIRKITSPSNWKTFSRLLFVGDSRFIFDKTAMKGSRGDVQVITESKLTLEGIERSIRKHVDGSFDKDTLVICNIGIYDFIYTNPEKACRSADPSLQSLVQQAKEEFRVGYIINKAKRVRKKLQQLFTKNSEVYFMFVLPVDMMPMYFNSDNHDGEVKDIKILNENVFGRMKAFNNYVKFSTPGKLMESLDYNSLNFFDIAVKYIEANMSDGVILNNDSCSKLSFNLGRNIKRYFGYKGLYENVVLVGDSQLDNVMRAWPGDRFNCTVLIDDNYKLCHVKEGDPLMNELAQYKNSLFVLNLSIDDLCKYREFRCEQCKISMNVLVPDTLLTSTRFDLLAQLMVAMENAESELKKTVHNCTVSFALAHSLDTVRHQKYVIEKHSQFCNDSKRIFNPSTKLVKSKIENLAYIVTKYNEMCCQYGRKNELFLWDKLPFIYGPNYKRGELLPNHPVDAFTDGINPTPAVARRIARYFFTSTEMILKLKPYDGSVKEKTTINSLLDNFLKGEAAVCDEGNINKTETCVQDEIKEIKKNPDLVSVVPDGNKRIGRNEKTCQFGSAVQNERKEMNKNPPLGPVACKSPYAPHRSLPPPWVQCPPTTPGVQYPPNIPSGVQYPPNTPFGVQYPPTTPGVQYPPNTPSGVQYPPNNPSGVQYPPNNPSGVQYPPINPGVQYPANTPFQVGQYPPHDFNPGMQFPPPSQPQPHPYFDPSHYHGPDMHYPSHSTNAMGMMPDMHNPSHSTNAMGMMPQDHMHGGNSNVPNMQQMPLNWQTNSQVGPNNVSPNVAQNNLPPVYPPSVPFQHPGNYSSPASTASHTAETERLNNSQLGKRSLSPSSHRSSSPFFPRQFNKSSLQSSQVSRSKSPSYYSTEKNKKLSSSLGKREEKALLALRKIHNRECDIYKKNPKAHSGYQKEFQIYNATKIKRVLEFGDKPDMEQIQKEWEKFWEFRIVQLQEENWITKREECLAVLSCDAKQSAYSSDSSDSRYSSDSSTDNGRGSDVRKRKVFSEGRQSRKKYRKKKSSKSSSPDSRKEDFVSKKRGVSRSPTPKLRRKNRRSITPEFRGRKFSDSPPLKSRDRDSFSRCSEDYRTKRKTGDISDCSSEKLGKFHSYSGNSGKGTHKSGKHSFAEVGEDLVPSDFERKKIVNSSGSHGNYQEREEYKSFNSSEKQCKSSRSSEVIGNVDNLFKEAVYLRSLLDGGELSYERQPEVLDRLREICMQIHNKEREIASSNVKKVENTREVVKSSEVTENIEILFKEISYLRSLLGGVELNDETREHILVRIKVIAKQLQNSETNKDDEIEFLKIVRAEDKNNSMERLQSTGEDSSDRNNHGHLKYASSNLSMSRHSSTNIDKNKDDIYQSRMTTSSHPRHLSSNPDLLSKSTTGRMQIDLAETSGRRSSEKKQDSSIEVLEVLSRFGDDLGSLKVPLRLLYDKAVNIHSAGLDVSSIFSDNDNMTLLFLISSKLKKTMNSPHLSIIQKVIMEEAIGRLDGLLENSLPELDVKNIAFDCLGKSDSTIKTYIHNELVKTVDFAITPKQIMKLFLRVKEEQERLLDRRGDPASSMSFIMNDPSTLSDFYSLELPSIQRASSLPRHVASLKHGGIEKLASKTEMEDVYISLRLPQRRATTTENLPQSGSASTSSLY